MPEIKVKYRIVLGEGLFDETWTAEIEFDWLGHKKGGDLEFWYDHVEFHGPKNGMISETGYRSEFTQIEGDVPDFLKRMIKARYKLDVHNVEKILT